MDRLLKNTLETGSATRKPGSGRPKTASVPENIEYIKENICTQEDKPVSHLSLKDTGILGTVGNIFVI